MSSIGQNTARSVWQMLATPFIFMKKTSTHTFRNVSFSQDDTTVIPPRKCRLELSLVQTQTSQNQLQVDIKDKNKDKLLGSYSGVIRDTDFIPREHSLNMQIADWIHSCTFTTIRSGTRFYFQKPKDFCDFQMLVTRQKIFNNMSIPIKKCTYRKAGKWNLFAKPISLDGPGSVQLFEQITSEDYRNSLTSNSRRSSTAQSLESNNYSSPPSSDLRPTNDTESSAVSVISTISSDSNEETVPASVLRQNAQQIPPTRQEVQTRSSLPDTEIATNQYQAPSGSGTTLARSNTTRAPAMNRRMSPRRLAIFTESGQLLTFNMANGLVEKPINSSEIKSGHGGIAECMKFEAKHSRFAVGITVSGFPGIPLDPKSLCDREKEQINYLELEFNDAKDRQAFNQAYNDIMRVTC